MDFASYVYIEKSMYRKFKKIKKIVTKRKKYIKDPFYAIILNEYNSQLEFENYIYLQQLHYVKRPPIVVGIAEDYNGARELCAHMVHDCIKEIGTLDYIAYLSALENNNSNSKESPVLLKREILGKKVIDD